jgi:hypothetical protein
MRQIEVTGLFGNNVNILSNDVDKVLGEWASEYNVCITIYEDKKIVWQSIRLSDGTKYDIDCDWN